MSRCLPPALNMLALVLQHLVNGRRRRANAAACACMLTEPQNSTESIAQTPALPNLVKLSHSRFHIRRWRA